MNRKSLKKTSVASPRSQPTIQAPPSNREVRFVYFSSAFFTLIAVVCNVADTAVVIATVLSFAASKLWLTPSRLQEAVMVIILAVAVAMATGETVWIATHWSHFRIA